jgi:triacylglycerol lipase
MKRSRFLPLAISLLLSAANGSLRTHAEEPPAAAPAVTRLLHADVSGLQGQRAYLLAGASATAGRSGADLVRDLRRWGFDAQYVQLFTTHDPRKVLTDTQCFAAWNDDVVLVSFRGTRPDDPLDWATDLRVMCDTGKSWDGTRVHEGFSAALDSIWSTGTTRGSEGLYDVVRSRLMEDGHLSRHLWLTGHSLGGALALLASWRFASKGLPVSGVSVYGSPRVGDEAFAARYDQLLGKERCQRFIYNRDLVPRLPPRALDWMPGKLSRILRRYYPTYGEVGTVQYMGDPQWAYHEGKDAWRVRYGAAYRRLFFTPQWWDRITVPGERDRFLAEVAGPISDHFLSNYQSALWKKLSMEEQAEIPPEFRLVR